MPEEKSDQDLPPKEGQEFLPPKIEINYRKTEAYQSYHTDGFVVGITPKGYINLEPFTERAAIPRVMIHDVYGKKIGPGKHLEGMQGILRLIQAGLILDIGVAESLVSVLSQKIEQMKKLMNEDKEGNGNAR